MNILLDEHSYGVIRKAMRSDAQLATLLSERMAAA
jgi:hypothetical protein